MKVFRSPQALFAVAAIVFLANCSGHSGASSIPYSGNQTPQLHRPMADPAATSSPIPVRPPFKGDGPGARLSSSHDPSSFASLVGKAIGVSDVDRFIDPSVTGADRKLAEQLMWSMPLDKRGDFVYIRKDGTILSNRPEFARGVAHENYTLPADLAPASRKTDSLVPSPGADIGTGPYFREQSQNGLTALLATVTLECDDEALAVDKYGFADNGFAYSGGSGYNGSSVDAGLQYNPDGGIQPFISYTAGAQWTNQSQHYYCNSTTTGNYGTIGIFFGEMPSGNMMFLATGLPENPPSQSSAWPSTTNWDDSAWVYFDTPGDWYEPGTDAVGQPTVCYGCTVKRITSIGQKGGEDFWDNSCFGGCGLAPYYAGVHWGSVKMGQIINPCPVQPGASSTTCTIQGYDDGRWFGSLVDFAGNNSTALQYTDEETTYASEGINLDPPAATPTPSPRPSPTINPPPNRCGKYVCY